MHDVEFFPSYGREIENVWIPMSDGRRLAARLWLPQVAERGPIPALLESVPYRKRDGTRERDETMYRWFAARGFACVRTDVRGTGDSEGVLLDEYTPREQQDGFETIAWMASQSWCNGAVGLLGKSWGGIAALQVAALRPPALRAVISVCSTDDRWATDAHWMGGALLVENLLWGAMLLSHAAQPPDPEITGSAWRERWRERLAAMPLYPEIWMQHSMRDAYWRQGSVCEDFERIQVPVLAVGGWADAYPDAVLRLLSGLPGVRRGILGPWAHLYPHEAVPGPAIGFLQEALRWWQQWLLGIDTGIEREPMLRAWMQSGPPGNDGTTPGRWIGEAKWPASTPLTASSRPIAVRPVPLVPDGTELVHHSAQTIGLASGSWCSFGIETELAPDTRPDDLDSLIFESAPLEQPLEILGTVHVTLALSVDTPQAFVAVRLMDVAPDRSVYRVTWGVLDLSSRDGTAERQPITPGVRYALRVPLRATAYAFATGHCLRIAVSTSYWPIIWPPAVATELHVVPEGVAIDLPVRRARATDAALPSFEAALGTASDPVHDLHPGGYREDTDHNVTTGMVTRMTWLDAQADGEPALVRFESIDLELGSSIVERFTIHPDDPLSATAEVTHRTIRRRGEWETRVVTQARLRGTQDSFLLNARVEAFEGNASITVRHWDRTIPRPGSADNEPEETT